jgi:hypothetical protein
MANQEQKQPTREKIEQRAYEIYLQEGGLDGRADEHWLRAESELLEESRPNPQAQVGRTPVAEKSPVVEKAPIASRAAKR